MNPDSAADVLDRFPDVRVVSLDFFDTLVTRSVAQPTHVFAEMEHRLVSEGGRQWRGFAHTRVSVEHDLRVILASDGSLRDITHGDIMNALQQHLGVDDATIERIRLMECACEIEMAQVVPFGRDIAVEAMSRGLRVIIVSDNYMSSAHLEQMAHAAGLGWVRKEDIFVSCEHGGMKQNGELWKTILARLRTPAKQILHIGDHFIPDAEIPHKLGIHCHIDARSSRWHRHPMNTSPSVLPFSRIEAAQRDECYEWERGIPQKLAEGLVAMMVAGQVHDVKNVVESRPVVGVHFAARDGWLAENVWRHLRKSQPSLPEGNYLSFSRSVIGRANITEVTDEVAVRFVDDHEVLTPRRLSKRFGCEMQTTLASDASINATTARQMMLENAGAIVAASAKLRERVIGHLRANGVLTPGHHLVVDLGWRGSTVADLAELVEHETNGAATVEGRFLGLYWDATMNRLRVPLHGYAMDDFGPLNDNIRLLGAVRLFEFLLTAPHGSVIDFEGPDKNFEPTHSARVNQSVSEDAFLRVVLDKSFHAAVAIVDGTHPSGVALDDITPESVWAAMMQVAHTPRSDELDELLSHVHVASVDHADGGIPLIAAAPKWSSTTPLQWYSRIYDDTMKTRWFQGSLREWHRHESSRDFADGVMRLWPFMGPVWCDAP